MTEKQNGVFPNLLDGLTYFIPALAVFGLYLYLQPEPGVFPDTNSYLRFSGFRVAGYPYFLKFLAPGGEAVERVVLVQHAIFAAASLAFTFALRHFLNNRLYALLAGLIVVTPPTTFVFHSYILTESLFISATLFIVAGSIYAALRPGWVSFLSLGFTIGTACLIKSISLAFLPLLPLFLWIYWKELCPNWRRFVLAVTMPIVLALFLEPALYRQWHGDTERSSLLPLHIFAKAAMIDSDGQPPYPEDDPRAAVWDRMENSFQPVRDLLQNSPSLSIRSFLSNNYEVFAQYRFAHEEISQAAAQTGKSSHEIMIETGFDRIVGNPGNYLLHTLTNYYSVWTIYKARHPWNYRSLLTFLQQNAPVPFAEKGLGFPTAIQPAKVALFVQPGIWAIGIASLGIILFGLYHLITGRSLSGNSRHLLFLALMIHGNFCFVALAGVGIVRYTLSMWPPLTAFAVILTASILGTAVRRLARKSIR